MKRKASLILALLLVFTTAGSVFAQGYMPVLNGNIADGANKLDAAGLQNYVKDVSGPKFYILTYYSSGTPDERTALDNAFMKANGLLNSNNIPMPDIIVIRTAWLPDTSTVNKIYFDKDRWGARVNFQSIQDNVLKAEVRGAPTSAMRHTMEAIMLAINPPPTATPQPAVVVQNNQTTTNNIDTEGIARVFGVIVLIVVLFVLGWLVVTQVWPEYRRRQKKLDEISALRGSATQKNVAVATRLPTNSAGNTSMASLILALSEDAPLQAEQLQQQYAVQRANLLQVQQRTMSYARQNVSLFDRFDRLETLLGNYQALEADRQLIEAWLQKLDEQAHDTQVAVERAPVTVGGSKKALTALADPYLALAANSKFLPRHPEKVLGTIAEVQGKADQALEAHRPFTAVKFANQVTNAIEAYALALEAFVKAETALVTTEPRLTAKMTGHAREIVSADEILHKPTECLKLACDTLVKGDFAKVKESAEKVIADCEAALKALAHLVQALEGRDANNLVLNKIYQLQYKLLSGAKKAIGEVGEDLKLCNEALANGDFILAERWIVELASDSKRALTIMQEIKALHDQTETRYKVLSREVALKEKNRTAVVIHHWVTLQKEFAPANWQIVAKNFDAATKLLADLFDDPADANDLASQVETLNGFAKQDFEDAEHLMTRMEADLSRAILLLDQLEAQYMKAMDARDHHQEALRKAQAKFELAVKTRDANDKYITPSIDKQLTDVRELAKQAQKAAASKVYVDCMALCQQIHQVCDQVIGVATKQVAEMNQLIEAKEERKQLARKMQAKAQARVEKATRAAVTQRTRGLLEKVVATMQDAARSESVALTLEDKGMAKALEDSRSTYDKAVEMSDAAIQSLEGDEASYRELIQESRSAVDGASEAVRSAQRVCSDGRSGSYGDSELARAKDMIPSLPQDGATRDSIEKVIDQAAKAEKEANRAKKEALAAVQRYEDEQERIRAEEERRRREEERRRREEEEERERERREQQRREEEDRRADERRRDEESRNSFMSSTNESGGSSLGSTTES